MQHFAVSYLNCTHVHSAIGSVSDLRRATYCNVMLIITSATVEISEKKWCKLSLTSYSIIMKSKVRKRLISFVNDTRIRHLHVSQCINTKNSAVICLRGFGFCLSYPCFLFMWCTVHCHLQCVNCRPSFLVFVVMRACVGCVVKRASFPVISVFHSSVHFFLN